MFKKTLIIVLLGYSVIGLLGCNTPLKKDDFPKSEAMLEPAGSLRFSDIPVPAGFKLIPEESYSFESSGVRVVALRYQGKADADRVVNFYKEQMAMYNWNLLNIIEYGDRLLNFERESESCIITLQPRGGSVIVSISSGPKSPAMAKKAKEPIK